jgi:hypothetical protein
MNKENLVHIHKEVLFSHKEKQNYWPPKVHAYNPSFLGGWDQEDHSSRPVQAKKKVFLSPI